MDRTDRVLQVGTAAFIAAAAGSESAAVTSIFTFLGVLMLCEFMAHDSKDEDDAEEVEEDHDQTEEE